MNIFAKVFLKISDYEINVNKESATFFLKKAIEYNAMNTVLTQSEIDELISEHANKSVEINISLLAANIELLKNNLEDNAVILFLSKKYFTLDGLSEVLLKIR